MRDLETTPAHPYARDQTIVPTSSDLGSIIDYRNYVYGIGNERAPPIVMYSNVLKHSPEYLALTKI